MSAETTLYSALSGDTGVGAICDDRIFPDVAPQDASLPAIAFERTGTEYLNTIHGTSLAQRATISVFCMADTRIAAEGLCDAVQAALRPEFVTIDRRAEFNPDQALWATVLTVDRWE